MPKETPTPQANLGVAYFKIYTARVPVPAGQEAQAENVARSFAMREDNGTSRKE